jgi:hypothetical protein
MTADFFVSRANALVTERNAVVPPASGNHRGDLVTYTPQITIATAGQVPVPVPEANGIPEHDPVIDIIPGGVPSQIVPFLSACRIFHDALGAGVTMDIGFADDERAGISGLEDAIRADIDVSAAGNILVFMPNTAETAGRPLWQIAGLTEDPRTNLCPIVTFRGAAPDPGRVVFEILAAQ